MSFVRRALSTLLRASSGNCRPPAGLPRYAREIVIVLIVKVFAMMAIWYFWFSGPTRKGVDADRVAERVYSSNAPTARKGPPHARP
jgi:hypothetical protein